MQNLDFIDLSSHVAVTVKKTEQRRSNQEYLKVREKIVKKITYK